MSQDRTGAGMGLDRQEAACRKLIAAEELGTVVRVYPDNDVSATSGKLRKHFEEMLRDGRAGRYDAIVVWHQDRLVRQPRDLDRVIDLNMPIHAVKSSNVDLTTASGRAVARTLVAWALYEVEAKGDRQREANAQAAQAGAPYWRTPPFGYNLDQTVVPEQRDAVQWAAATVLGGGSIRECAREFTRRGLKTSRGSDWSPVQVRRLLLNPRIAGLRSYSPKHPRTGEAIGPPAEYPGTWEPLIPEPDWRLLKAILEAPERGPGNRGGRRPQTLLTGIATCGRCGAVMRGALVRGVRYYQCASRVHYTKAELVDEAITTAVLRRLAVPDAAAVFLPAPAEERDLAAEIASVEREMAQLEEGLRAGALDMATFLRINTEWVRRRDELRAELTTSPTGAVLAPLIGQDDARARWDAMVLETRRSVLTAVLDGVRLDGPKVRGVFDPSSIVLSWKTSGERGGHLSVVPDIE